jgi:hypothetical protein
MRPLLPIAITHASSWTLTVAVRAYVGLSPLPPAAQAPRTVSIVALDYAFQAPDTIPAGPVLISFVNRGAVRHEVVLYVAHEGSSLTDYLRATGPVQRQALGRTIGLLAAEPGQPSPGRLVTDLVKGRTYVLLCNLQNASEQPPHSRLGMGKLLVVK